ncbi:MAG TPA: Mth938-like domain-containing protein [Methylophilaceae bacterium]|nr:Mth938-like domain-containing protein [Methylophilaceae bacterium]HQC28311.1 Mth938-like domain-containing protein [Methylotenera sp.]
MKLHLTTAENNHLITAYDTHFIEINKQKIGGSLLVMPQQLIKDWGVASFATLNEAHIEKIAEFNPEVVLLGTGEKHQFLHPNMTKSLTIKGIPLECMTTAAACRTYNILMSEGRNVLAALIVESN